MYGPVEAFSQIFLVSGQGDYLPDLSGDMMCDRCPIDIQLDSGDRVKGHQWVGIICCKCQGGLFISATVEFGFWRQLAVRCSSVLMCLDMFQLVSQLVTYDSSLL